MTPFSVLWLQLVRLFLLEFSLLQHRLSLAFRRRAVNGKLTFGLVLLASVSQPYLSLLFGIFQCFQVA